MRDFGVCQVCRISESALSTVAGRSSNQCIPVIERFNATDARTERLYVSIDWNGCVLCGGLCGEPVRRPVFGEPDQVRFSRWNGVCRTSFSGMMAIPEPRACGLGSCYSVKCLEHRCIPSGIRSGGRCTMCHTSGTGYQRQRLTWSSSRASVDGARQCSAA